MNQHPSLSDINISSTWIRYLPCSWQAYALLCRLDRPIGTWLLFLPSLWGILLPHSIAVVERTRLIILFALGSLIMRGAGCVINDLWDRNIDKQVARTKHRPIASGVISFKHALFFLLFLLIIGLLILLQLNKLAWILGAFSLILVALYPTTKRFFIWPQLILGFTFGFGAPLGYAATAGYCSWAQAALYSATIFWQIGFDTIYSYQDIEDDQRVGIHSTARWAGQWGKIFVGVQFFLCLLCLSLTLYLNKSNYWTLFVLFLPALHFFYQVYQLNIHNPQHCLKLFKSNRNAGLLIALVFLIGDLLD